MDRKEAVLTAVEILFRLDIHNDIKETLLTDVDLSDEGYQSMMATLMYIRADYYLDTGCCPECEGTNLNADRTKCFDCDAQDYTERFIVGE